jgi:hypothetical protein
MKITADAREGAKSTYYSLNLHSGEGKEPFMTIKGCRLIDGTNGPFVSFPSHKDDKDKYWPHVWASDGFHVEAIKAMRAATPAKDTRTQSERRPKPPIDDSAVPF